MQTYKQGQATPPSKRYIVREMSMNQEVIRGLELMIRISEEHVVSNDIVKKLSFQEWSKANDCANKLKAWLSQLEQALQYAEMENVGEYTAKKMAEYDKAHPALAKIGKDKESSDEA